MTSRQKFFLLITIVMACSTEHSDSNANRDITDAAAVDLTREEKEKAIFEYYQTLEREVKKDLGISKEEIDERIQSLIDEGHVQKPLIFIDTGHGIEIKIVDYMTYKEFSRRNSSDFKRRYKLQPEKPDSLFYDSIRNLQLQILPVDSAHDTQ